MTPRPDVSALRRPQIMEAALACFIRKGYVHTSMDDIVAACGLSKGSVYWYFPSKEALFAETLGMVFEKIESDLQSQLSGCRTAAAKLRLLAAASAQFGEEESGLFSLFLEFWRQIGAGGQASHIWASVLHRYKELTISILQEGRKQNEFRDGDYEQLVWAVMAAFDGLATYKVLMPELDLPKIGRTFIEVILAGLKPTGRKPKNGC